MRKISTLFLSYFTFSLATINNMEEVGSFLSPIDQLSTCCASKAFRTDLDGSIREFRQNYTRDRNELVRYLAGVCRTTRENGYSLLTQPQASDVKNRLDAFNMDYSGFGIKTELQTMRGYCDNKCRTVPSCLEDQYHNKKVTWQIMNIGEMKAVLTSDGQKIAGIFELDSSGYHKGDIGRSFKLYPFGEKTIDKNLHNLRILDLFPDMYRALNIAPELDEDRQAREDICHLLSTTFTGVNDVSGAAEAVAFLMSGDATNQKAIQSTIRGMSFVLPYRTIRDSLKCYAVHLPLYGASFYAANRVLNYAFPAYWQLGYGISRDGIDFKRIGQLYALDRLLSLLHARYVFKGGSLARSLGIVPAEFLG